MKKHLIPLFFLSLCGGLQTQAQTAAQAQQPAQAQRSHPFHRWSIHILAGGAIPVGKYGDLDHQDPGGGPIHTGGVAELSGAYHLNRSLAIVLLASGQQNKGNGIAYVVPAPPPPPGALPGDVLLPIAHGRTHWMIARAMTGAEYSLPLNKQKDLDLLFRLLGGGQTTKPADYNFYFANNGGRLSYPYLHLPWSFSYQIDAGLKWQQQGHIALIAYAGYNGSQPSKALTYEMISDQVVYTTYDRKAKFPTSSLLFRAGIEIGL